MNIWPKHKSSPEKAGSTRWLYCPVCMHQTDHVYQPDQFRVNSCLTCHPEDKPVGYDSNDWQGGEKWEQQ
jgi:hypothetical protein